MFDRIAIAEGHYVAALDWGDYAKITRLQRMGLRTSPLRDTHAALIESAQSGDDIAHRAYHVASRRYHAGT